MSTGITADMIRQKLFEYIRVADKKQLQELNSLLEAKLSEMRAWWEDSALGEVIEKRYTAWAKGGKKGFSQAELDAEIRRLKVNVSSKESRTRPVKAFAEKNEGSIKTKTQGWTDEKTYQAEMNKRFKELATGNVNSLSLNELESGAINAYRDRRR